MAQATPGDGELQALPLPLTPIGKKYYLAIGLPLARLLRKVVMHQSLGPLRRNRKTVLLLLLAVPAYLQLQKKRRENAIAEIKKRADALVAENLAKLSRAEQPKQVESSLPSVLELLRTAEKGHSHGIAEFVGCGLLCVAGSLVMMKKAVLLGLLFASQQESSISWAWISYAIQYPGFCVLQTMFIGASQYLRSRIKRHWRRNVTYKLHSLYFSKMRYYRILNETEDRAIPDPDIRICTDVESFVSSTADLSAELLNALVCSIMFGTATVRNRHWSWALACPAFFVTALGSILACDDVARHATTFGLRQAEGYMKQMATRLQLQAERVCMLQGEAYEQDLLKGCMEHMNRLDHARTSYDFFPQMVEGMCFGSSVWACFIETCAWLCSSCMIANDITAGAAQAGTSQHLPIHELLPQPWLPFVLAIGLRDLHGFFNTAFGWGALISAYVASKNFAPLAQRVQELYAKLQSLEDPPGIVESSDGTKVFSDEGPTIAFDSVTIQTPSNQVLLSDLTFRVNEGESLLICGHNGAGKSSIIRTLCNLWPVAKGRISRPGGSIHAEEDLTLHDEVYYLPQKPCNVLGSLSDQLTYPLRPEGGLPEEELRRWLRYVGLEYLVESRIARSSSRIVGVVDSDDIDWEVILSTGEQQALSIARLLYHHPRFAILDECTSAVGKELERRLFELAPELGITCITITHRPALIEHHGRMLQLTGHRDVDGKGWQLTLLPHRDRLAKPKPRCGENEEVHARIESYLQSKRREAPRETGAAPLKQGKTEHEFLEERSEAYKKEAAIRVKHTAASAVLKKYPSRLARLWALISLGLQTREEKIAALKKVGIMAVATRARMIFFWWYWRSTFGMFQSGLTGDLPGVLCSAVTASLSIGASGFCDQIFKNQARHMLLDIAVSAATKLLGRVMSGATLVQLMSQQLVSSAPPVDNPVVRLSEITAVFDVICEQVNEVVIPFIQGAALLPTMVRGVGAVSPLVLIGNFLLFRGAQLIAPNFADLQARNVALESRFQVLHTRLRSIAEPVAFSGGGAAERSIIEGRFQEILEHQDTAEKKKALYNMMVTFFTDYRQLPLWTHRLVSIIFSRQNNPVHPAGVSAAVCCTNLLFDRAVQFPQVATQKLVRLAEAMDSLDGQVVRCLELLDGCDNIDAQEEGTRLSLPDAEENSESSAAHIVVRNTDLVTPSGVCLASGLSFEATAGVPLVVTGPNASGKSLLGSVLLGLWPAVGPGATVTVSGAASVRPPLAVLMPAPQQIYMASGNLLNQIVYPILPWGLRFPSPAPRECLVMDIPPETTWGTLMLHFVPLGAVACRLLEGEEKEAGVSNTLNDAPGQAPSAFPEGCQAAVVTFEHSFAAYSALARPQDHVVDGQVLRCEFWWPLSSPRPAELPKLLRARRCLEAVNIEHVLLREPLGWLAARTWEDTLSGGEQQRLCLARLLYHRPVFGLLDECTSMVAADSEQELYKVLFKDWSITPITLTQRLFMPDFYAKELSLGVPCETGWELAELRRNR